MKRKLFCLLTLLLAVCSGAWAEDETWTTSSDASLTRTHFTVALGGSATQLGSGSANRIKFAKNASNTMTISTNSGETLDGITFDLKSTPNPTATTSVTSGTWSKTSKNFDTWTKGSTGPTTVTFTFQDTKDVEIQGITVTYTAGGGGGGDPTLYTVAFNAGEHGTYTGGDISQTTEGGSITLPSLTTLASGYTFNGWFTAATDGTKAGNAGASYTPANNMTLYAQYSEEGGGSGSEMELFSLSLGSKSLASVTQNTEVNLSEGGYATVTGGSAYIGNKNSDATKALINNTNGVHFNGNDAYVKVVLSDALATGDVISFTNTVNAKQVCFTTTNSRNTTYHTTSNSYECSDAFNGVTTIYIWRYEASATYLKTLTITRSTAEKHSVTYSLGDATGGTAPTQSDVAEGKTFTVAAAPGDLVAPTGKEFKCWNDGTVDYNAGATYTMGTSNVTLTAVYQDETVKYTITYSLGDATGGTVPTQSSLAEGQTFIVAAAPGDLVAPTGKEFKCWNDGTADYNAGDTYTIGTSNVTLTAIYQDETYKGLTPAATLDLSNAASSTFTTLWYSSNNVIKDCYYNAVSGVVTFSPFAIYSENASGNKTQTWATTDYGSSTGSTWAATGTFKGNSYYFSSSSKSATVRNTERMHYYRVTNCSAVDALMGGKAIIEAYEVIDDVVSAHPVKDNSINEAGTLSLSGLNASKEYIIKVYGNNGGSNVVFNEIAFTFPAVSTTSATVGVNGYTTFASPYALDLTDENRPEGLKAYKATRDGANLTFTEVKQTVPAGTGLLLLGETKGGSYDIPVVAEGDEVSGNALIGVITPIAKQSNPSGNYYFAMKKAASAEDALKFAPLSTSSPVTIPAGKIYIEVPHSAFDGAAHELSIAFEDEGETTSLNEVRGLKADVRGEFYNLNGQRVAQPTKGLYIVNGRKVVIK